MEQLKRRALYRALPAVGLSLFLVLAAGCREEPAEIVLEPEDLAEPLYFETIGRGQSAEIADTVETVFRDSTEWQSFQGRLEPMRPFTPVDFTQAMVMLVALPAPSSGYSMELEYVDKLEGAIDAGYVLFKPAQDCMIAPARTEPFVAVLVRRTDGEVSFTHRTEELPCTFR